MDPSPESLLDHVLSVLARDFVYPAWITGDAANLVKSREDHRTIALGVAATAILLELVVPGNLGDDGFEPLGGSPSQNVLDVAQGWLSWPGFPDHPGEVCWFAGTEQGIAAGQRIIDARNPGEWDEDMWGSGDLSRVRAAIAQSRVTLRELLDAVDLDGSLPQDRDACVLGLVTEAVLSGQVIVEGIEGGFRESILASFEALHSDEDLVLIGA